MSIDFKRELNEEQFEAVSTTCRRALILAGAGAGKTRTLTHRVAWLLENGVQPWQILLLTFTNKAATEMLSRVENLTGFSRKEYFGGTFHSVGQRILRANAEAISLKRDFSIIDADDAESLFAKTAKSIAPEFFKNKNSPKPGVFFDALSFARNTLKSFAETAEERIAWNENAAELLPKFAEKYTEKKREQNLCDYDDLLELFVLLLEKNPEIRERYQRRFLHILVDEFQDTNSLQAKIVKLLAAEENSVMAVGDDAQCIYTWRGANYENISRFEENFAGTTIFKIETNYRSTPEILDFSNSILRSREEENFYKKELKAVREQGQKPLVVPALDAYEQAKIVIRQIATLVNDGGVSLNDIAVLYRAHSHAKELQIVLSQQQIPFLITSGLQFFQQAHVRDFVAILRFLANPDDVLAFVRILKSMEKIGPKTAEKILGNAKKISAKTQKPLFEALLDEAILKKIPEAARDDFRDFALTLQNMNEAIAGTPSNFPEEIEPGSDLELFKLHEKRAAGTTNPESAGTTNSPENAAGTRIAATPAEIVRLGLEGWYRDFSRKIYADFANRKDDLDSLVEFAEKFSSLEDLLTQMTLLSSENTKKDANSSFKDAQLLRLSTIHQAKGLEFPIVFLIGCADEMFPTKRAIEEGNIDEERRLFYVAATRARDELYILYPKMFMRNGSAEFRGISSFFNYVDPETFVLLKNVRSFS